VEGTEVEVSRHRGTWAVVLEAMVGSEADGGGLSTCMCSKRWMADDISLLHANSWRPAARCQGTAQEGEAGESQWLLWWPTWWSAW
jgi:hypothetical protein